MKFNKANDKLKKLYKAMSLKKWLDRKIGRSSAKVYSFDLLSGVFCPMAMLCRSRARRNEETGKRTIEDGPRTKFRCFSASQEVLFTNVYENRKRNGDAMLDCKSSFEMADKLIAVLPKDAAVVRIHVAGDMFNNMYFRAWMLVACRRPDILFYAYTKSLQFWIDNMANIPHNLVLTASRGGTQDSAIEEYNLREAVVVFSKEEADEKGLEIDNDDSHAADPARRNQSFALLIHGVQPKGSEAAAALRILKKTAKEEANA